jgi:hypothetical protein
VVIHALHVPGVLTLPAETDPPAVVDPDAVEPDLRIASIALANDLVLVTGNVRHFRRVPGLVIEDWLA